MRPGPCLPLLLLLGCGGKHDVVRRVESADPVAVTAPPPAPPFVAPPTWNQGRADQSMPRRTPVERWSTVLGGPISAPVVTDGTRFYAIAAGRIRCMDDWGKTCWEVKNDAIGARFGRGELAVLTKSGSLERLDPLTGTVIERLPGAGPGAGLPVETASGWRWVAGGQLMGGAGAVKVGSAVGQLAADGDKVYVAVSEGRIVAVEGANLLWDTALGRPALGGVTLSQDKLYVPIASVEGQPGGVAALNREGQELWRTPTELEPAAAPSLAGSHVLLADRDGYFYAVDAESGEIRWKVEGFGAFLTQPFWWGSAAWVGNGDGKFYRMDLDDATVATTLTLGASITGEPALAQGILVVGLANGRVVGLNDS